MIERKFLIGISGGSGSGKTTIANALYNYFGEKSCIISEDDYYKDTSLMEGFGSPDFDFDHPRIRDHEKLSIDLANFKNGIKFEQPIYDFVNHCRKKETKTIIPTQFLIIEGTHLFVNEEIRNCFDLKIYVDTNEDERFSRRLKRDIIERGRTKESVETAYYNIVRPAHYLHTEPTRKYANLILDCNESKNITYEKAINDNVQIIIDYFNIWHKNAAIDL